MGRAVRGLRAEAERRPWAAHPRHGTGLRGGPLRGGPLRGAPARSRLAVSAGEAADRPACDGGTADGGASDALAGRLAQMCAATTHYVCGLRAEGVRPEQMLVRVKGCVRAAMAAEGWHDPEALQVLTAEVVRWSIDAYYDR